MLDKEWTPETTWDAIRDPSRPLRRAIRLVQEANEQFVALLRSPGANLPPSEFRDAAAAFGPSLSDTGVICAARVPYLLFNFCFDEPTRWSHWATKAAILEKPPLAYWAGSDVDNIARATATIAWITCNQNPRHAGLTLGASPTVPGIIASLQLRDLSRIATEQSAHLRPRWEFQPHFWNRYLASVHAADEPARLRLATYGIQLLAGQSGSLSSLVSKSGRSKAHLTTTYEAQAPHSGRARKARAPTPSVVCPVAALGGTGLQSSDVSGN